MTTTVSSGGGLVQDDPLWEAGPMGQSWSTTAPARAATTDGAPGATPDWLDGDYVVERTLGQSPLGWTLLARSRLAGRWPRSSHRHVPEGKMGRAYLHIVSSSAT